MRKSIQLFLTVISIFTMTITSALFTPPAGAVASTTSEAGINFIKNFEGFRSRVYWDSGSAFIGYGTICRSWDYPDGISEAKADALMREALLAKEATVNKIFAKYSIQLTQNQYDAVLSFTYNLGTGWMSSETRLFNYLINGVNKYTGIQIVNAISTWCHEGKAVSSVLVDRRIKESKIFLYADYDGTDPHSYKYLTFDAGDGEVENSIVFFENGTTYGNFQAATLSGHTFAGWVNGAGEKITPTTVVLKNQAVTAVWIDGAQPVTPVTVNFPDVPATSWYYKYVKDLSGKRIIGGYPDGTFKPDNIVSYGEALKLILRAVGFDEQLPVGSNWASGYLKLAISKGIVATGEIADLTAPISRLQIAQFTAKALGLPPVDADTTFADTSDGFVLALYHTKIITGSDDSGALLYNPTAPITRAEIAAIIWRIGSTGVLPY